MLDKHAVQVHAQLGRPAAFLLVVRTARIDLDFRVRQRALIEDFLVVTLLMNLKPLLRHIFSFNIFARLNRAERGSFIK